MFSLSKNMTVATGGAPKRRRHVDISVSLDHLSDVQRQEIAAIVTANWVDADSRDIDHDMARIKEIYDSNRLTKLS
jgi:hypothetical protein